MRANKVERSFFSTDMATWTAAFKWVGRVESEWALYCRQRPIYSAFAIAPVIVLLAKLSYAIVGNGGEISALWLPMTLELILIQRAGLRATLVAILIAMPFSGPNLFAFDSPLIGFLFGVVIAAQMSVINWLWNYKRPSALEMASHFLWVTILFAFVALSIPVWLGALNPAEFEAAWKKFILGDTIGALIWAIYPSSPLTVRVRMNPQVFDEVLQGIIAEVPKTYWTKVDPVRIHLVIVGVMTSTQINAPFDKIPAPRQICAMLKKRVLEKLCEEGLGEV